VLNLYCPIGQLIVDFISTTLICLVICKIKHKFKKVSNKYIKLVFVADYKGFQEIFGGGIWQKRWQTRLNPIFI